MVLWVCFTYLYLPCTSCEHVLPLVPPALSVRCYFPSPTIISQLCSALELVLPPVPHSEGQWAVGQVGNSPELAQVEVPADRPGKMNAL